MEKEAKANHRWGGGVADGLASSVAFPGDGACPRDRCCPDPGLLRGGPSRSAPSVRVKKPKNKKKNHDPFAIGSPKVWPGNGAQDEPIQQSITFQSLAASLPRWILATRARFAAYLAKTFHLQCGDSVPSTVVFPLPLADLGLFRGGASRLSKRRWLTLVRKRLLHIIIVALNYLHDGFHGGDVALLGRRPNEIQKAIHKRLWSLVAACDTPGEVPLSPGRSGKEFIARLHILEEFAKTCPFVCEDLYEEGPQDFERKVGFTSGFSGSGKVDLDPGAAHDLAAYRPLDVERLKLTGKGEWDLAAHLHDELWLPFVEPLILRHGQPVDPTVGPNFAAESKEENFKLAKLWSSKGFLELSLLGAPGGLSARVFNNFKNPQVDRMIGDRRLMNAGERSLGGPSKYLPGGYMMTSIHCPRGSSLYGIVTDRKDFYHQAMVTRARAESNSLPFSYDAALFKDDEAYRRLEEHLAGHHGSRELIGDRYGKPLLGRKRKGLLVDGTQVFPAFRSLYQGDHLGVEFALSSHSSMLSDCGLLKACNRVLGHHPFPFGPDYEGLVIDDYFSISCQPLSATERPRCLGHFEAAVKAYESERVLGSPEKDVTGSQHFAVVAASLAKRLSLVSLSLRVAALPVISRGLASRLSGTWTSVLMFRRCLVSVLDGIYKLGVIDEKREDEVLALPRQTAEELVLASVFAFVASSNVQVPYCDRVFATDASLKKGAITSRFLGPELAKTIWLGGDKRGAYTKLDNPFRAALRGVGFGAEDFITNEENIFEQSLSSQRKDAKLCFSFDFCEICGGSGVVSAEAASLGLTVMQPIELSDSVHFDLGNYRLVEWICFMLQTGRLRSIMCEPPCQTFSAAAHPAVRSYKLPKGFNRRCRKTWFGNLTAFRCLFLSWVASIYKRPNLFEQPFLSKMAWLPTWRFLMERGFHESSVASCMFGSPHLKKFRLLSFGLDHQDLSVACDGAHTHVRIEGQLTKASAVYVPRLAKRFAGVFAAALKKISDEEEDAYLSPCIESVVLNDLLMTGDWRVDLQWFWATRSHINLLESHAYLSLLRLLVREGGDLRFTALLDSRVAKCSHAKGRSSSKALMPSLRKAAALQICGGLYSSLGFAPTRLNTADDPTRDVPLRPSCELSCLSELPPSVIQKLHSMQLSRPTAGWIRLALLLGCLPVCNGLTLADWFYEDHGPVPYPCGFRSSMYLLDCPFFPFWIIPVTALCFVVGFSLSCHFGLRMLPTISAEADDPQIPQRVLKPRSVKGVQSIIRSHCLLAVLSLRVGHAMFQPGNAADRQRAERRIGTQLFTDRVLRPQTRSRRDVLLRDFDAWTVSHFSESIITILEGEVVDAERVANLLVGYGRSLYYGGRPYGVYSETINAVTSKRGNLRRMLGLAWDLAFSWVADEPASHHPALPRSVLLAFAALAMLWTWTTEAGIFLLSWCGLLRIGEVISARRRDLILPQDGAPGITFVLLRITTPKTRGRTARHQSARVDQRDVVEYLSVVFAGYQPDQLLWPMSSSTLRKRLNLLQTALGMPTTRSHDSCPYDLGSFRPGGATDLLQQFEDSELVRRRGRWVSHKVLEIYLQEVSTATFHTRLSAESRSKISRLSFAFTDIRLQCQAFLKNNIPAIAWRHLWSTQAWNG